MASIEEFSRFDFVLEVKTPADTLESTCAAALYNRMLTTPKDLSKEVVHILVLRLEAVSSFERTGSIRGNEAALFPSLGRSRWESFLWSRCLYTGNLPSPQS